MDELRAASPLAIGGVTVVVLERREIRSHAGDRGFRVSARAEPAAVLVRDASGLRAFDATGEEVPVEPLIRKIPGLASLP